jgi:Yip1-like protein
MTLQQRVINILTTPATEWPVIAAEKTDAATLYTGYIVILAAIPAICGFIGTAMLAGTFLGGWGIGLALRGAIVGYVTGLVGAFVAAVIIEKLAPNFGSSGDTVQALKLVAYASTPVWVSGVLNLLIILAVLRLVAVVYAVYLFYLGLPPVMKTPADKVVPYMVVSAIVIIIVQIVISVCLRLVLAVPGGSYF